ncbi:MAG TPA: aminotransferase class I/II-fold pyridoxal phosphate-dependent enzyme [Candidatus Baltobacteraceae bacterium]|jgi:7-keto-8-aminopelargonate synthetase-like enzyme|nr:aminotransferase class I/II-fold pyridoxal phosphate-dependent enzyme [Candidatus Baltobacteraceae bacterium]
MSYLRKVDAALDAIRAQDRYREQTADPPKCVADFSRNDYLALAGDSRMVEAMRHVKTVGSGGARLLGGRHREHALLETDLARWLGRERALLFSSGYLAALGALQVLAPFAGAIYSDERNHACLIDGIRAAKRPRHVYAHGQMPAKNARAASALVVSETLFGMDGTMIDVRSMLSELGSDDMLLLDEAHALGILGAEGAGLARGFDDERIVVMGTLGKAIGASGGFIAGPSPVIELLVNAARTFIFDTALPPAMAFAARVGVMLTRTAGDRRARLESNVRRLHDGLRLAGIPVPDRFVPIVPVQAGSERAAMEMMNRCLERGVYAPAVRPPTVPPGGSRLRVSVRADHTAEQIDLLLGCITCTAT